MDGVISEPIGGAHRDAKAAADAVKAALLKTLAELKKLNAEELKVQRYEKYRNIGMFSESKNQG